MKTDLILVVGAVAAFCTTVSFIPQVIKTHRTKHTKDLSLGMLALLALGLLLWSAYGILLGEAPIIIANTVTFVLVGYILLMKLRSG